MSARQLTVADIKWADTVFVSAMLIQKDSLQQVITLAKAHGKKVVVGGPYASIGGEALDAADHVFVGEAETTLPEFLDDLERGEPKHIYKALERPPLSLTPIPDFRLAEMRHYSDMSVQYSRGCPFNCEFCDIIEIYGRVPRTKSNEQMLAELDALLDVGWRGAIFIVDDNFIGNKRNVKKFLPALGEWSERHGHPFSFITEASVNLADDDELLGMMKKARFERVFVGIETPVTESLKEAQKGQNTRRDLIDSVRKLQDHGIEVMAGFIVGFDHDPDDIFERQINFIRGSAIPLAMVGLLAAIPDTQLWRRLEREGRLLDMDHSGNNTDCVLNFAPKMDPARLVEGYKSILRTIYDPGEYYQRSLDSLARVKRGGAPKPEEGLPPLADIIAFFRIFFALGLKDRERSEFWRYVRRVFSEHRENIEHGMRLAAMGYHFRKLTDRYCN
jgi:radical SAM superfamily enzyme YgiQ (UPF0313 family)